MPVAKCAWPIIVYGAVAALAAQSGFVPARYRDVSAAADPDSSHWRG
jgi:hypothetical protein